MRVFRILTFLFIGCVICYSCSETKKINKAEQIVLTHKPAFDYVGQIYMTLFPCISDTNIMRLMSDTVVTSDTVIKYISGVTDDLVDKQIVVWDTVNTIKQIYITKKITIHDTDLRVVRDIRKELMLSDSLDYYKKYYNVATKEVLVWKLSARQRLWYLIAAGLVVLLGIIIKLKI